MPKFFTDAVSPDTHILTGEDAAHIVRSLRMRAGEELILCDARGVDYPCRIRETEGERVVLSVGPGRPCLSEPSLAVTLFQCLPKGDKMDWIIQKAVELGVGRIVPVLSSRSISRPDPKTAARKQLRWQKIAREAAMQSSRGRVPLVDAPLSFDSVPGKVKDFTWFAVLYEGGGLSISTLFAPPPASAALFVGPEGGISPEEVRALREAGAEVLSLGARILRTETAPIAALAALMFATGNLG